MTTFRKKNKLDTTPVLLFDGGIISLSVARSLGKRGIPVYSIDIPENHARFSRYSKRIPFKENNIQAWMEWLTGKDSEPYRGSVIFPCSDHIMEITARHRAQLATDYILPEANDDVLLAMLDKAKTYPLAKKSGVPIPQTWIVRTREDIETIINLVPFPCALKPRYSHEFRGRQFIKKLFIVNNKDELIHQFNKLYEVGIHQQFRSDLIVTEIIPGEGDHQFQSYYTYIDENGMPLFHFTKRKLRQYPNFSGNGTYHISDWNPKVVDLGLQFFKGVGYCGLGNVEFKLDPRDGKLKLMECNARLTLCTEVIRRSGFDITLFIYNRLTGQPLPPMGEYRHGVRLIRPIRDFLAFKDAHRRGILTWGQWLRSVLHKQHFEAFTWYDPLPWVMMGCYFIRRFLRFKKGL
jgi:D-aspartate ligase